MFYLAAVLGAPVTASGITKKLIWIENANRREGGRALRRTTQSFRVPLQYFVGPLACEFVLNARLLWQQPSSFASKEKFFIYRERQLITYDLRRRLNFKNILVVKL